MAWTADDLAALDKVLASGVASAEFQSRKMTYHSVTDLLQLRTEMLNDISSTSGTKIIRQLRVYTDNGW